MSAKKTIPQVFEDEGFKPDEPIPLGRVEEDVAIQNVLRQLKDYPKEIVIDFIKKEIRKSEKNRIAQRKKQQLLLKKYQLTLNEDLTDYLLEPEQKFAKTYSLIAETTIKKVIKWYVEKVVNS